MLRLRQHLPEDECCSQKGHIMQLWLQNYQRCNTSIIAAAAATGWCSGNAVGLYSGGARFEF